MRPVVQFQAVDENLLHGLSLVMRHEDRAECYRQGYGTPIEALRASVAASELSFGFTIDGQSAAVGGFRPTLLASALGYPVEGFVWVLTGDIINKHPREYMRHSKTLLSVWLAYCPLIRGTIDVNHAPALRWARWVGATLSEPVRLPPYGLPFIVWELKR